MLQETVIDVDIVLDLLAKRTNEIWSHTILDSFEEETTKLRDIINSLKEVPQEFDSILFNSIIKQVTLSPAGKVTFIFLNNIALRRDYNNYSKQRKGEH